MSLDSFIEPRHSRATIFFTVLGAALILLGIALHAQREIQKQGMQETTGVLISFFQKERGEGFKATSMCPVVSFHTTDKVQVTVEGHQCSKSSTYKVGDHVTVFYPLEHPERALLVVPVDEWFYVVLSCLSGAMMWLFACCAHTPKARAGFNETLMDKWCLTITFGAVGLVLCGISFWVLEDQQSKQAQMTEITTGTVTVSGFANTGRNSISRWAPFDFKTTNDELYEISSSVCSDGYVRGERVPVRYNPANPRHAMLDSFWDNMFLPGLLFLLGSPFLLGFIAFWPRNSQK